MRCECRTCYNCGNAVDVKCQRSKKTNSAMQEERYNPLPSFYRYNVHNTVKQLYGKKLLTCWVLSNPKHDEVLSISKIHVLPRVHYSSEPTEAICTEADKQSGDNLLASTMYRFTH